MAVDGVDLTFSILSFVCFVIGTPSNALSLYYFLKKRKYGPTCIYITISGLDVLTCIFVLPVGKLIFKIVSVILLTPCHHIFIVYYILPAT